MPLRESLRSRRQVLQSLTNNHINNENSLVNKIKGPIKENDKENVTKHPKSSLKRKSEDDHSMGNAIKKAFGDVTNNKTIKKLRSTLGTQKENAAPIAKKEALKKWPSQIVLRSNSKSEKKSQKSDIKSNENNSKLKVAPSADKIPDVKDFHQDDSLDDSIIVLSSKLKINTSEHSLEHSTSYVTASEGSPPVKVEEAPMALPFDDYDAETVADPYAIAAYASDVFKYYKKREEKFPLGLYLGIQSEVTSCMRSILVDWMVEVQESFELNHETLYMAVKVVDMYLSKVVIRRKDLQLVGSTAIFIASKFDERTPPLIQDFLYICDDAYSRRELILLEMKMLKTIGFDLGIPLSYRFLRRYSRCGRVDMQTLTLSRYFLELSLMEYEMVPLMGSGLAAAALFLARLVREKRIDWVPVFKHYSGLDVSDFRDMVMMLHSMLLRPVRPEVQTIKNKYSHRVFHEVAKIAIPEIINF